MKKENLRPEDLMVGDWFRFRYTIDGKETVHTFRIGRIENELGDYYVWGERSGVLGRMCYPERLEPIPLTPEILKKNGFVPDYSSLHYLSIENGSIRLSEHQYGLYCTILRSCQRYDGVCNYVHELQHALKLCGIDKEIIL